MSRGHRGDLIELVVAVELPELELPRRDLERPGRTREAVSARPPGQDQAHAVHDVLVHLARSVLAAVVQQTRFSFTAEPRYSAHRGRGNAAHVAGRSVAAQSQGDLQDHPDP